MSEFPILLTVFPIRKAGFKSLYSRYKQKSITIKPSAMSNVLTKLVPDKTSRYFSKIQYFRKECWGTGDQFPTFNFRRRDFRKIFTFVVLSLKINVQ